MTIADLLRHHVPTVLRPAAGAARNALLRLPLSDKRFIERRYARSFGRAPDLRSPRTFNEKVNWRKLYDRRTLHQMAADRVAVRGYVAAHVGPGYLVPILGVLEKPEDIPWANLSTPCVIKTTHSSAWNVIVHDSADVNPPELSRRLRWWLRSSYYYREREWAYRDIPRRIVIERFVGNGREVPEDFKFFCFDGTPRLVQVDYGRFSGHTRTQYDTSWAALPFRYGYPQGPVTSAPSGLAEMVQVAQELSQDFDFVRVDLYCVEGRVYFGELTIYPEAGFMPFTPPKWDEWLGAFWKLPATNSVPSLTGK